MIAGSNPAGGTMLRKQYLGDGVYIADHDLGLVLTTENGIEATTTIVLELEVLLSLLRVVKVNWPELLEDL
jgi:hypothetical protein